MVRTLNPERRAKFLSAALRLFVANGVTNTSTAEIAREAGTAAGTLFLYFPTKQALLDALILQIAGQQTEEINSRLSPALSARDTFYTIWQTTLHWFVLHLEAYLYVQQVRDSGMISPAAVEESNQLFSFFYLAIQKGLEEGSIQSDRVELIGSFLYYDIVAVMNLIRTQPDASKREESIRQGFEIFWDGIKSTGKPNQTK
jgi:AcrR family transcriptional regulator